MKGVDASRFLLGLLLFSLFLPSPVLGSRTVIESESQFDFARTLMKGGEFSRAVLELERFIYFFPQDEKVPTARYLIGLCYLEDNQFDAAREVFERVISAYSPGPLAGTALFMIGESYYRQGVPEEAAYYFKKVVETSGSSDLKGAALYRLGWAEMRGNRWQRASEIFGQVGEGSPFYPAARNLSAKSLEGSALPRKSPALAGGLAAALPGLGHAYVGRYKDGGVAFLLNGLFILAAVEAFRNDLPALGGILGFLELGWYSGNIYSAVNVAQKYNRRIRDDFLHGLEEKVDLPPPGGAGIGLTLSFRF